MPRNSSTLNRPPVQIALGLAIGLIVILVCESASGNLHFGSGTQVHSSGDSTVVRITDDGDRLEVRLQGDVELLPDDSGIARMGAGSRLLIDHRIDGLRHKLEVTRGSDGEPEYDYRRNRKEAAFDANAKTWLGDSMVRFYRASGVDSQRRVARLLGNGGVDAVLAEVAAIDGDRVQRIYLGELLEQSAETTTTARVLTLAARNMGSSYESRQLLRRIDLQQLQDAEVREAYQLAARAMESDYEVRSLLVELIDDAEGLSPEALDTITQIAKQLNSDHELAEILTELAPRLSATQPFPVVLDSLIDDLGSNHELRRVLATFLGQIPLLPTTAGSDLDRLLKLSQGLSSSYDRAELLAAVTERAPAGFAPPESFFRLVAEIGGDYERYRVLDSCSRIADLQPSTVGSILSAANELNPHPRGELLIDLASRQLLTGEVAQQALQLASSLSSEYERQQVADAVRNADISTVETDPETVETGVTAAEDAAPVEVESAAPRAPQGKP